MKTLLTLMLTLLIGGLYAKKPDSEKILKEGKLLYRLEKASWFGTDDFLANYPDKRDSIGGYLSYATPDNMINTIFFSRYNPNHILIRYHFDSLPVQTPISVDTYQKKATSIEEDLIAIRQDAIDKISENSDGFFTFYEETSLNPIPLITEKEKKVYILTGPQVSGVVLIGNDYLLSYDEKNNFIEKRKIHNSLIQTPYKSDSEENKIKTTYHSHVNSEVIDPTDICTLLLYKDYVEWKQHYVISKDYVSIFDLEKEQLVILTKKAWDKMNGNKKEKN